MSAVWKELPAKGEVAPLRSTPGRGQTTNYSSSADESDVYSTGFAVRDISHQAKRTWLLLQIVGLLFQFNLWREVSSHLADFEGIVSRECVLQPQKFGVCAGPSWENVAFEDFALLGLERHTFTFAAKSSPPTLLLSVNPLSAVKGAQQPSAEAVDLGQEATDLEIVRWELEVTRLQPPATAPRLNVIKRGQQVITLEDFSDEAVSFVHEHGYTQWEAVVSATGRYKDKTRFVAFAEDAASKQLMEVHQHPQCAFGKSWKAFNQQHQGHSHRALSWCRLLLGVFLVLGSLAVYGVHQEVERRGSQVSNRRFHLIVLVKFFLQDVPQQICVVLYIFGWYEAAGLRCQLCLFDPQHCSDESAFHFANAVAIGCILLSSLANQILIRPARKRVYTEDDICMHWWVRIGGSCVSTLPFTTGLCLASRSLLSAPTLTHLLFALPCAVGWMSITGFVCMGLLICCDDDEFY